MLVPHYEIRLSAAEQQGLEALQRAGKTPQQTGRRVSILLSDANNSELGLLQFTSKSHGPRLTGVDMLGHEDVNRILK